MKHHLRQEMKRTLAGIPAHDAHERSRRACRTIAELGEFVRANVVMLYLPIPHEVDSVHLALEAWQAGKTVVVPKVSWTDKRMVAVECQSIDDEMDVDGYGLRTPRNGRMWPYDRIDLIVVPALAFDRQGRRLGRGGGFYDRFLAEPGVGAVSIGVAFDEQILDELPALHHDRPVDILVSDRTTLRFARKDRPDAAHTQAKELPDGATTQEHSKR